MSLDAVVDLMLSEQLGGNSLNDVVGGGDPRELGRWMAETARREGNVGDGSKVLEIGSGCGRAAVYLADVIGESGRYVGVDIVPGLTMFCRREISSRRPGLTFYALRMSNPQYDVLRGEDLADDVYVDDLESTGSEFDAVCMFSVVTHLQLDEVRNMFRQLFDLLAPEGTLLFTTFLLDTFSRRAIQAGEAAFFKGTAEPESSRVLVDEFHGPNSAVAYGTDVIESAVADAGFAGIQSVSYGTWRSTPGKQFQDLVVARKTRALPSDFDANGYLAMNPDVERAGVNPANHYQNYGRAEGRRWREA